MAAFSLSFEKQRDQVLFEGNSFVKKVILNRPKKLNSLNYEMVSEMVRVLKLYERDPIVQLVILKGNGRAFCSGGDLLATMALSLLGHWSISSRFYEKQFVLDYQIATFKKPVVCIIDGIVMGGGAGLSMNARFRIVTEKTVFAMPEVSIGLFPDVGASYFLSRLPGYFGEYLGLTGATLNGAEMVACGLATHFIISKDIALLEHELLVVAPSNPSTLNAIIEKFAQRTHPLKENSAFKRLETINKCFSKETVEKILLSLEHEMENKEEKWIVQSLNSIKSSSPMSLKITLRLIREGRTQNLRQCLIREHNTCAHVVVRRMSDDLYEGCRVMLSNKGDKPKWEPSKLELVTPEMVDAHFQLFEDEDFEHLQLPCETPNFVNKLKTKL